MCNLLTGSSKNVPLQMMKNENVVLASLYTLSSGTFMTSHRGRGRTTVLCAALQCSLIETEQDRGACCLRLQSWWRQKVSVTHWYCSTRLHSVTHQKTVIFTWIPISHTADPLASAI